MCCISFQSIQTRFNVCFVFSSLTEKKLPTNQTGLIQSLSGDLYLH